MLQEVLGQLDRVMRDGAGDPDADTADTALHAALAVAVVLVTPGLPKQLYQTETLEGLVELAWSQLLGRVLPALDTQSTGLFWTGVLFLLLLLSC